MANEQQTAVDELWVRYFQTHDADVKNQIVFHYLYIVGVVVRRLMPQYKDHNEKDELMSCGVLGLIDAVDKFDRSFGVKFQTYAAVRIRGEILDYMRRQDWAPSSLRKRISDIQQTAELLETTLQRKPTDQEIADYLGVKPMSVRKVRQKTHMFNLVYFEALPYEKEPEERLSPDRCDPYQIIESEVISELLNTMIDGLPERKKTVIRLHYYEGQTMKSIARKLQISESRVSQIHSRILLDMKTCLQV
jgi:RNA polymerase sigma factor for flagellar operon FliA